MMSKLDWTTAPEGAEVWIEDMHPEIGGDESGFFYSEGDSWVACDSSEYWSKEAEDEGDIRVHCRPKAPAWNGEGLPPVGMVCECGYYGPYWHKCEIVAEHKGFLVVWDAHDLKYFRTKNPSRFRPIKSDREKWIEQAGSELKIRFGTLAAEATAGDLLPALYDAGLAKLP